MAVGHQTPSLGLPPVPLPGCMDDAAQLSLRPVLQTGQRNPGNEGFLLYVRLFLVVVSQGLGGVVGFSSPSAGWVNASLTASAICRRTFCACS